VNRTIPGFFVAVTIVLAQTAPTAVETVRRADEAWANAVASRSVEKTVAMYDADALTAGSAMPPARGLAEIRAMWEKLFAQPGFSLTWRADKIAVSASGSIATSTGNWSIAADGSGPYLAVWRKQRDGTWKVLVDAAWYSGKPQ
jgi:ketosteroid isomerase-like protein